MAAVKAVIFATIAFVIFDAALFDGHHVHEFGRALSQIRGLNWKWL
jgi:hypothetical protein